jgi:hypothetical protein
MRDKFHGTGELSTAGGKYSGDFRNGIKEGFGKMTFKNGCRYEGKWKAGRFDGKGLYVWTGSSVVDLPVGFSFSSGLALQIIENMKENGSPASGPGKELLVLLMGRNMVSVVAAFAVYEAIMMMSTCVDGTFYKGLKNGSGWWR